jgi:threonine aldolase
MNIIDLRSDTVTQPTPAMRQAMAEAPLGDDVYGEDPTVNALQKMAAELMGKEAALLVVSGSMGNLVCGLTHCQRGDEMIIGSTAHILLNETGSIAGLGGIQLRSIPTDRRGFFDPNHVEQSIRKQGISFPKTAAISMENTHNRGNGAAFSPEETDDITSIAHRHDVPVHLDGARIFNASVALAIPARDLVAQFDSVTFCLSKGLAGPVGSLVCGDQKFIDRAKRTRKMLGGGMRQAGVIAAAGIVALETMIDRLAEDHINAKRLAAGLAHFPGLSINPDHIETNIVYVDIPGIDASEFVFHLKKGGVLVNGMDNWVRLVTHYGITAEDIDIALDVINTTIGGLR